MDLQESQVALERDIITHGVDTYRRTQENLKTKGRQSETTSGRRLVAEAVNQTSEAISAFVDKATAGGSGRRNTHGCAYPSRVDKPKVREHTAIAR